MKRFLSFVMTFVLVLSAFVGCSKPTSNQSQDINQQGELKPEEGATIVVWESQGAEGDFIKYAAQEFEKRYGIKVKFEPVESTQTVNKLQQDGPAGVGADIIAAPHDQLGKMVAAGLIQPNHNPERFKKDFLESAVQGVTYEGEVYGYPIGIETYALFYNKDIIKQPPKTFEEIIEFAKKYNNPKEKKYALMWNVGDPYYSYSFLSAFGGYVFGNNGTNKDDIGLNNEGAIEGAKYFKSLRNIYDVKQKDANYQFMSGQFENNKAAMIINGPWAVAGYKKAKVNFGVAPLPTMNGKQPISFSGVRGLYLSSFTKYPNAAKLFLDFVTSDEMLLKRFEMTGQIPPVKSLMDKPEIKDDPIVAGFMAQAQYSTPMPSIPQMSLVWEPLGAAFSAIWDGKMEPKEALDKAVQTIKDAIATQK
ncbi:carbohydrate ABC transporter substrate-binding protein, CUT1 family (TC 3.A.1.1.-) [Caloramator fervidus]|uniref:Maltodextrin-binding protein n=1 Tax=Caloramator fervidus TaxID=29344 RepID=A0A1H5RPI1_9CLOT|nr:maltose ABC transporter substrate-binding protein [Caloramator fervidus]SEF40180.1 carbohydrate ABC transporter substrate-binding protein, CUT1 family (TC 3.A.1.1.-) [Caloramator fervidus]